MHYPTCFATLSLLASLAGCSSKSDTPATEPPPVGTLVGSFQAELIAAVPSSSTAAFTKFLGVVYDGEYPDAITLKVDSEQGGCKLWVPKVPFCSTSCGATGVCTDDDECTPYPKAQDLGMVHVTGLGDEEVVMEGFSPSFNYQPAKTLPNPSCSEGAAVTVKTDKLGIEVTGKCIAPFVLTSADPVPVSSGKGIPLTWTAPGQSGFTKVHIHLDIAHHGGKKGEINCEVPDTGSFEIPEPLVTKLVSLGLAGFPTIDVGRASSVSAPTQSRVTLSVISSTMRDVDSGVKSCSDAADCVAPATCQADLTCK